MTAFDVLLVLGWMAVGAVAAPWWVRLEMSEPFYSTRLRWTLGVLMSATGPTCGLLCLFIRWLNGPTSAGQC